ncbi:MerR family transcriptional regulator [Aliiroseovarius sp. YM-037]|uniref:MerR family transcriptional regulator n=1 Tax=Aliiroseovarius sp. YM-037 TaxID=3341728 RepID=UPI003A80C1C5
MDKSPDAFRTIREVSEWLDTPAHVLRFWESKFSQVKPVKRAGGRRYYRPNDMLLLGGIKKLLHQDGMTIKGVQKLLHSEGVKVVSAFSQPLDTDESDVIEGTAHRIEERPEPAPVVETRPEPEPEPVEEAEVGLEEPEFDLTEALRANAIETPQQEPVEMPNDLAVDEEEAEQAEPSDPAPTFMHRRPEPEEPSQAAKTPAPITPVDVPDDPADDADIKVEDPVSALLLRATAEHLHSKKDAIAPLYERLKTLQSRLGDAKQD